MSDIPAQDAMPGGLICPASDIFDAAAYDADMARDAPEGSDARTLRGAATSALKSQMARGRDAIAQAFTAAPISAEAAEATAASYAWLTDQVLDRVRDLAVTRLHPLPTPTEGERIAVMAVGGYGRAEMAPFSDVDLLFLTPYKITPWAESIIESMLYILWDLHLKVGHSARTVKDCLRLAREDQTIRTALLENRLLGGDVALAEELNSRLRDLFDGTGPEFIEAKLTERDARHVKQGARYVVEPNVKEGKGGLRDLQALYWIVKYISGDDTPEQMMAGGFFRPGEYERMTHAEDFLMAVRCHLHLLTGRAQDQLTFDLQPEVAARMGYVDTRARRGVELFMQDYFRAATVVGDTTRILITALEGRYMRKAPFALGDLRKRVRVKKGYKVLHGRLTLSDPELLAQDPIYMLRLFAEALRTNLLIHADAMRDIRQNLTLIDDAFRANKEANRIFLDLLLKYRNPERALLRMNELGVLAAFLPDFAPIVAMMQFNMYHHYTVDEHTIQCVAQLSEIEQGVLAEDLPVATEILRGGVNRRVLTLAVLLHDIGKGLPEEDHSIAGARIARKLCPRLGLRREEVDTVEWLVRYHLLMSDIAQKRDLSDPRTVRDFAKAVKTRARLDLLLVLTVCDIRGVGPGVWNNWKAQLLRTLHAATADALENGLEDLNRETRETEAKRALRATLSDWPKSALKLETGRHYGPYWQGMPLPTQAIFARLLRDIGSDELRMDLMGDPDRDATRACFVLADHPGIFSRLAGALALVGANVVDARTYTSKDGWATAVFWIQDADGHPFEESRLPRLRDMIGKTLRGEVVARDALPTRDRMKKRERPFRVPTSITFDNDGSEIYTILEVDTRDRPGLLYDLTRVIAGANISIASAGIATYGEQVVDTFYVKDMFGLKLHSEAKRATLERNLREAITAGVKRARAD